MTNSGTLIDALPDRPADPHCFRCGGKGFWWPTLENEFAKDCPCRFSHYSALSERKPAENKG